MIDLIYYSTIDNRIVSIKFTTFIFVLPGGIEAYSFSTGFAWCSLRSAPYTQPFRFPHARCIGTLLRSTKIRSAHFCPPGGNRTLIKSLEVSCSIH